MAAPIFACPGCGEPTVAGTERCARCHIRLVGELALQLWRLDQHLAALRSQRDSLVATLRRDDDVLPAPQPSAGRETRRLLLVVGAVCLIAALTAATALIWPALGVTGQTAVLLLVTAALFAGAARLRRLPATGEALAAVGVAAVAVDLVAGRRLVAPDLSGGAAHGYWLLGSLVAAVVLAAVVACARWLHAPAVGAVLAAYGAVVAAIYPHSVGGIALVGVLGAGVSFGLLRAAGVLPSAAVATATVGAAAFAATGAAASLAGAGRSGLALWCGVVLGCVAPLVLRQREIAAAGGLLVAAVLLLGHVIGVVSTALPTAATAGVLLVVVMLPTRLAWQPRVSPFVLGGAFLVETVAQTSLQLSAVQDLDLARGACGLAIVAVLALVATVWSRPRSAEAASGFAAVASIALMGAVAELLGGNGARTAADGTAVVAGTIFVVAVALAASVARTDALIAGAVATATSVCTSIAVGVSLGVRDVTTVEAYVVAPGVVCGVLGVVLMARLPRISSWTLLPAVVVSFAPTLLLAMRDDLGRQVAMLLVGATLVAIGAQLRLLCPLAAGAATVVLVTARLLGPEIVQLPRWLTLSVVGMTLILLGATWERRLQDLRTAADRVRPAVAALR